MQRDSSDGLARSRGPRTTRWMLAVALALTLATALYLTAQGLGLWEGAAGARVKGLVGEEQEIAWIEPATNTDDWSQFVSGLARLEADWPKIRGPLGQLNLELGPESSLAFPQLTADVAEVAISFAEAPARKLWVRWYKISGDNPAEAWVQKLRARSRPPLAIVGGGTSDRAFALAHVLVKAQQEGWPGKPPLLLITTATAETDRPPPMNAADPQPGKRLMDVYAERTFRFCFTNGAMVRAVLGFLRENPQAWVEPAAGPSALASAGAVAVGDPAGALGFLQAAGHLGPKLFSISWEDDSYSRDLEVIFRSQCKLWHPFAQPEDLGALPYSVGDVYQPNAAEQTSVDLFLSFHAPPPRSILVLPAAAQRMRRYLGFLCHQSPKAARNLVVVNGDAINFHNVYRDRDFAWNVLDLPVPVVFFSHRNPVDTHAGANWGFAWQRDEKKKHSNTGTQDLLLYRDIIEAMFYAAFEDGWLLGDADRVRDRLGHTCWHPIGEKLPGLEASDVAARGHVQNSLIHGHETLVGHELFDRAGDRRPGTGEHIVWLRPNFAGDRLALLQPCTISIWRYVPATTGPSWHAIDSQSPPYNR
jgi:hypothetical protein